MNGYLRPFFQLVALLLALTSVPVHAQPSEVLQGIWNGTCQRNGKTSKASLVLAYVKSGNSYTGTLNNILLTSIKLAQSTITFIDGDKAFTGTFSDSSFNQLTGDLDKGAKSAKCSLNRQFKQSDTLCIYNPAPIDTYIWLSSPNGAGGNSTFVLNAGKSVEVQGDHTGILCFNGQYFKPPLCPAKISQSSYSCQ